MEAFKIYRSLCSSFIFNEDIRQMQNNFRQWWNWNGNHIAHYFLLISSKKLSKNFAWRHGKSVGEGMLKFNKEITELEIIKYWRY
jgi:hypothetical protein